MKRSLLSSLLIAFVALGGCFMDHGEGGTPPDPTFDVDMAISAVSLAEDCGSGGAAEPGRFAGDCAPPEDGGGCASLCQDSSVTIAIDADGEAPLGFTILRAQLLDEAGNPLLELSTSNARVFDDTEGYVGWDEQIPTPSTDLSVHYDLDGMDWSGIESSYERTFRLRLTVEVEGLRRILTSEETTREYPIVT